MKNKKIPLNLQFFAETPEGQQEPEGQQNQPQFDYEKLASIISGKQSVAEDTVLKNYFKQQGMSKEEMDQAINAFKQQKAANQPDVNALQQQAQTAQAQSQRMMIENAALLQAMELGLEAKTIPYVLKIADLKDAVDNEGKVNQEALKNALNKVLEDVPAFKPQKAQSSGFQIGTNNTNQQQTNDQDALKAAFGL